MRCISERASGRALAVLLSWDFFSSLLFAYDSHFSARAQGQHCNFSFPFFLHRIALQRRYSMDMSI